MKKALSLAILLLIGDAAAEKIYRNRHGKSYVQFLEGDFDDLNQDFMQEQQTKETSTRIGNTCISYRSQRSRSYRVSACAALQFDAHRAEVHSGKAVYDLQLPGRN